MMTHAQRRERRARMAEAVKAGGTILEVAAAFNVSTSTVRAAVIGDFTIPRRKDQRPRLPRPLIAEALADGKSIAEIAREFKVSDDVVRVACRYYGIKPPRQREQERHSRRNQRILGELKAGKTLLQVGQQFGLTRERVRQIAAGLGFTTRLVRLRLRRETERRRRTVARLAAEGKNDADIARETGIPIPEVCQMRNAVGIPANHDPTSGVVGRNYRIIADLINTTENAGRIAARFRCRQSYVLSLASKCRQAGIKLHPNRRSKPPWHDT